jgi:hypothetical protein
MHRAMRKNLDNSQTVQKSKLGAFVSHLSERRMHEVWRAVEFAFGSDARLRPEATRMKYSKP